ncbi:MAG: DUF5320 domain-containing protein [Geobacteraceae bacterium]|nr:DUF5320 domain-containing protein [Geobacteraceae bacterium]
MPRGDGTGPRGMGRMTGRGAGFCVGYDMPGFANQFTGRGFGMGSGRGAGFFGGGGGRGWRNCFYATGLPGWARFGGYGYGCFPAPAMRPDPAMEKQTLKAHADALETELEMIKQRLGALEENE